MHLQTTCNKIETLCSHLMMRWAAYWWRLRNWADMLASAARQLVWRYLSCSGWKHTNATRSHFWKHPCSPSRPCRPTLVRVMLNWMVRMTTRMSKLPREISVRDLSEYHVMFFSTCESEREPDNFRMTRCNGDTRKGEQSPRLCLPTTSWMERLKVSSSVRMSRIMRAM